MIDSAYLKRIEMFADDAGTIHVFLSNPGLQDVGIQDGFINNLPFSNQQVFLWHRISPNPIPSMEVGEIVVRLRKPLGTLSQPPDAQLRLITTTDEELISSIPLISHPFHFSFIGFSDTLDTIFLYMRNSGQRPLSLDKIFLGIEEVTRDCSIPQHTIHPNEKGLGVVRLDEPLMWGQHITVKATTEEGINAQSRVRAFSDFPLGYDPDGVKVLLFDEENEHAETACRKSPNRFPYHHLLNCPMHKENDHHISTVRSNAETILSKIEKDKGASAQPGYIHVCRVNIYKGCAQFGQIIDILRIAPGVGLLSSFRDQIPDGIDDNGVQYLTTFAKAASEPKPLHTGIDTTSRDEANVDATPELARLMVYSAISRGSKGIFYRLFGDSLDDRPELKQEIGRLNRELRAFKEFIQIGDPLPLSTCTKPGVQANTILAGDRGIVLILINQAWIESQNTGNEARYFFIPQMKFEVVVRIPKWLLVTDVYEVVNGDCKQVKYTREQEDLILRVERLDVTRQMLLTTCLDDRNEDVEKGEISEEG